MGIVQTVSTERWNFCQTAVKRQTNKAGVLQLLESLIGWWLLVPTTIVTSTIIIGFFSSNIQFNWATVEPQYTITEVIHENLKFCNGLTRLSPIIKSEVPRGLLHLYCRVHIEPLKQARKSVNLMKLFLICMSSWMAIFSLLAFSLCACCSPARSSG